MALRLVHVILPKENAEAAGDLLDGPTILQRWEDEVAGEQVVIKAIVLAEHAEPLIDKLQQRLSHVSGFRVSLLPIEATVPAPDPSPAEASLAKTKPSEEATPKAFRFSRQELYAELVDTAQVSRVYIAMVILSAIVASIGLLRDNVPALIGAMVVAPLLGPNVALSFATTLGDFELGRRALKANLLGIVLAFAFSFCVGFALEVRPETPQMASRTEVGFSDVVLALAAGAAAGLAFTTGVSTALIGVMVAVALLPPLVTSGLLFGAGHHALGLGAALLLATNVICVNLAGVVCFLVQGIRPRTWWEADRAKKATRRALMLWSVLLFLLVVVILLSQKS